MNTSPEPTESSITRSLVPDHRRVTVANELFGVQFPLRLEPTVFGFASHLCADYMGGYWQFWTLSNGGFYMAPESGSRFMVSCENGYAGPLSADAFGITCCLYSYSHLAFREDNFAAVCADHFHLLREFALDHEEASGIFAATD